ncbi:MAG: hypothetical protein HQK54_14345 [Oligoflexales bacterium]|nr:hypothetical protein [Oligoflexales bacterium]
MKSQISGLYVILCFWIAMAGCGRSGDNTDESSDLNGIRRCYDGDTTQGVDISYVQGNVDWNAVAASGRRFAIARISDGVNTMDNYFEANWSGIKRAGMIRGAYQYFRAGQDPVRQADIVIQHVGRLSDGDLPVALDLESNVSDVPDEKLVNNALVWLRRVEAGTGKTPIIYTMSGFFDAIGNSQAAKLKKYTLWVANYGAGCPSVPEEWGVWSLWQYSQTGSVPGIKKAALLDVFRGSFEKLKKLASGGSPGGDTDGFSYPNNARIEGDFFHVRDENGNPIEGRRIDNGDSITVIDVSLSKKMLYVEYPTASGVRKGWITNVSSLIKYKYAGMYRNGSTPEPVLDENGAQIGSLDPHETATPLYRKNGKLHVVYNTREGVSTKSGYVKYDGGFKLF